jgi:hypothetical protein
MSNGELISVLLKEAREARAAIRHALQFLEDPTHQGDGHFSECLQACRNVLKTDGKWEPRDDKGAL